MVVTRGIQSTLPSDESEVSSRYMAINAVNDQGSINMNFATMSNLSVSSHFMGIAFTVMLIILYWYIGNFLVSTTLEIEPKVGQKKHQLGAT